MSKVMVLDHPLIQHKVGVIRRKEVGSRDFRAIISEIAMLMCYEAARDLKLEDVEIETPICPAVVKELAGKKLAVVPILRAGLGMVDGILAMIPAAKVGHIGLYRDPETLKPVEYYCKLPSDCHERDFCGGSHAGHRRFRVGGYSDAEGQGVPEHPVHVYYRSAGGCGEDAERPSGRRHLHCGAG